MPELIGLDFETYGAEDLPTHGLARYAKHKTFMPLIGSVAWRSVNGGMIDRKTFDFVYHRATSTRELRAFLDPMYICAHNAPFEQMVLDNLGIHYSSNKFIDSAVVARAAGAGSSLEAAAPQLLDLPKLELGKQLIKLFSIPGPYQDGNSEKMFDPKVIADHPTEWAQFGEYCEVDASLSLEIVERYLGYLTERELHYQAITMDMNRTGWCVDVDLVEEMQRRYQENMAQALFDFRQRHQADELNLNSLKQLKEWCAERGVRASSFDEKHVDRLLSRIQAKLAQPGLTDEQIDRYSAVEDLLTTKKILGGSSLKKLKVILDTAAEDGSGAYRLWDQYLHYGAGQSGRTTGRSVQMQNLKRLSTVADMAELDDPDSEWDNTKLAENLRQVFTATDQNGRLIVGDFSSVESRGLAWLAQEEWKLSSYRQGLDLYKVLAGKIYDKPHDAVTKDERQTGKVGELACGYGAGPGAVVSFAEGMGVHLEEGEATKLVWDWRDANPGIVNLWARLDWMLHECVERRAPQSLGLPDQLLLRLTPCATPASLTKQVPGRGIQSVRMAIDDGHGEQFMVRYFHGCYVRGRNICYFRPTDRKTGDLWREQYVDPKTKQTRYYELYGGKLAGILTQSFCRELFFQALEQVHGWSLAHDNITLVGQFHDEIVVDWKPGWQARAGGGNALSILEAKQDMTAMMSDPGRVPSFPLAAEIKDDYRYTK